MKTGLASAQWQSLRLLFPALGRYTYLNTANFGPVSAEAAAAAHLYYDEALAKGDCGERWRARIEHCREGLAALIGASPAELGFVHNTSMAMNCAALLLKGSGAVLTGADEHPAVTTPWFALGYRVDVARPGKDGQLDVECYARAIRKDTRVIAISHVRYNDGWVNDLIGLGALARAHGAHLVVDGVQSVGILPVDVTCGIDVLGFGSFKWLNAGDGAGAIYVREALFERYGLPIAGARSRRTSELHEIRSLDPLLAARAFELGSVSAPPVLALGAAVALVRRIGIEAIQARTRTLLARLRRGLRDLGLSSQIATGEESATPIVSIALADGSRVVEHLASRAIVVALRGERIRISVSWYNDEMDIDRCLSALGESVRP